MQSHACMIMFPASEVAKVVKTYFPYKTSAIQIKLVNIIRVWSMLAISNFPATLIGGSIVDKVEKEDPSPSAYSKSPVTVGLSNFKTALIGGFVVDEDEDEHIFIKDPSPPDSPKLAWNYTGGRVGEFKDEIGKVLIEGKYVSFCNSPVQPISKFASG
jgi:hypothetical protein